MWPSGQHTYLLQYQPPAPVPHTLQHLTLHRHTVPRSSAAPFACF